MAPRKMSFHFPGRATDGSAGFSNSTTVVRKRLHRVQVTSARSVQRSPPVLVQRERDSGGDNATENPGPPIAAVRVPECSGASRVALAMLAGCAALDPPCGLRAA
jgi:hypothetical protein